MEMAIIEILKWLGVTVAGNVVSKGSEALVSKVKKKFSKIFSSNFSSEEKSDLFIEKLYTTKSNSPKKPKRDIEDIFEEITGQEISQDTLDKIVFWLNDHKGELEESLVKDSSQRQLNIGTQKAERDIITVQGDVVINNN